MTITFAAVWQLAYGELAANLSPVYDFSSDRSRVVG